MRSIFVTRKLPTGALDKLAAHFVLDIWREETPPPHSALLEKVADKDALLCLLTDRIDKAVIDAGSKLRVISNYAVGYDNIDIAAATTKGIPVGNTPDVLTETTADLAFALLATAARRIPEGIAYAKEGLWKTWSPTLLLGSDLYRATLGIVGMGRIGRAMARRARGFSMTVLYSDPQADDGLEGAEKVPMEILLERSDFVSLHSPLTDKTRHMIDETALKAMKDEAVLINTARGGLVDHDALHRALTDKTIKAAALDVTDPEPLPADHPLYRLSNCSIIPHLGSATFATRTKMAQIAVRNLLAGLEGRRLPHCVNPEVYGHA